jgi:DNA-binding response OmpR family regulator
MERATTVTRPPSILVVDDVPANLRLLTDTLLSRGYEVRPVLSGEEALKLASRMPPDVILLDINLPGQNGFEVCQRLKTDPALAAVPVIFISALGEMFDKVKGFEVGGVDYVTKPFQVQEVEARVRTHLELARLRRELERSNLDLEAKVTERTRELCESHRRLAESREQLAEAHARLAVLDQAKSDFLRMISHEVRTPLHGILGIAELALQECPEDFYAELSPLYETSRLRLVRLIEDALLLSEIGLEAASGAQRACRLDALLQEACTRVRALGQARSVQLAPLPSDLGLVLGDPEHLTRALQALLETAVTFAHPERVVRITRVTGRDDVSLIIETDGPTVPAQLLPRFFQLLGISETLIPGNDLGLAAPLAARIVTLYGGSVSLENTALPGVRLTVKLKTPATTEKQL